MGVFQSLRKGKYPSKQQQIKRARAKNNVSIPEKREIPFEEYEFYQFKDNKNKCFNPWEKGNTLRSINITLLKLRSSISFNPWEKGNTLRSFGFPQTVRDCGIVSIPEKREIPFEGSNSRCRLREIRSVSIPEKREIPFEADRMGYVSSYNRECFNPWEKGNTLRRWAKITFRKRWMVSIPEKREIPFEDILLTYSIIDTLGFNPWEKGNTLRSIDLRSSGVAWG